MVRFFLRSGFRSIKMRTGEMGVKKMRSLRKKKADLGKKMKKKKRAMLSLDPELIFTAEELLLDPIHEGQILGAEEEIDNGDGSLNIDAQLEKEKEEEEVEESFRIFLASFEEWVDNHDPIDDAVTI